MSSGVEIRAPAEQTEGTRSQILRWLKQVGESVAENEPLIEIETDKVTVEVASPGTGRHGRRSARPGARARRRRHCRGRGERQSRRCAEPDPRAGGCRRVESCGAAPAE